VINEHGGLEGIVTLEDLLEEIVGEISDEYDEEVTSQIQKIDGGYLLDGMLTVRDANRRLGLGLPESEKYMTIAGFLLAQARRLVGRGEVVEYEGALFTVENTEGRRILRVRYTPGDQGMESAESNRSVEATGS
jgi:CBS domain containing-hemolysin-like protein